MTADVLTRSAISLAQAGDALRALWGVSSAPGGRPTVITPEWVADQARAAGFDVRVEPMARWEDRSDPDLLNELAAKLKGLVGQVILVTEASYGPAGTAFRLDASELPKFLTEHQEKYEPVFNGDLVLAVLARRTVGCVHHENYLVVATPPPAGV